MMQFEPPLAKETLGPFFVENALSATPIFGPDRSNLASIAEMAVEAHAAEPSTVVDETASSVPLPPSFAQAATLAGKLKELRKYVWRITHPDMMDDDEFDEADPVSMLAKLSITGASDESSTHSSRSLHEALLKSTMETGGFPKAAQVVLDHIMLIRAKENYLLDCRTNRSIVDDDPWLQAVWGWIQGEGSLMAGTILPMLTQRQMLTRHASMGACGLIRWI